MTYDSEEKKLETVGFCYKKKCLVVILLAVISALIAAVVIALKMTRIRGHFPPNQKWWQKTIVYQIYPRSFQDSDSDGIGDLRGIISRLDYFKDIGVSAIWISPIYESPMKDFGYDISNFTNVDPKFGTLDTIRELIKTAHEKDLRVILDFVPNHTSNKHPWFIKSEKREDPYTDYYVWQDTPKPNNWVSIFGGSAWEWSPIRKQYYYHAFIPEQVDLNYRNPAVREEMKKVVAFWAEMGIDGLRVDAIATLFESTNVSLNDPRSFNNNTTPNMWEYYKHPYTTNYPEINEVITEWREVLDKYDDSDDTDDNSKLLVVEIYDSPKIRNVYYSNGADMPFNMDLVDANLQTCGGLCLKKLIETEYATLPEGKWPNFVMGNHDRSRITTKKGKTKKSKTYTNALNMLLLTLKGTPTCYYGDEIGMEDVGTITYGETQDPFGINMGPQKYNQFSRDPERTPMQWSNQPGAGFTNSSKPWLPINVNYHVINVESQMNSTKITQIKVYKILAKLRQEPAFMYGRLEFSYVDDNIISFIRMATDYASYLVVINLGTGDGSIDYTAKSYNLYKGTIVASTGNFNHENYKMDSVIGLDKIKLSAAEGFVVKLS